MIGDKILDNGTKSSLPAFLILLRRTSSLSCNIIVGIGSDCADKFSTGDEESSGVALRSKERISLM